MDVAGAIAFGAAGGKVDGNKSSGNVTSTEAPSQPPNPNNNQPTKRARPRQKKKQQKPSEAPQQQATPAEEASKASVTDKQNKTRKKAPRRPQRQKYPWRKHIPPGTDDPITLESLASLKYPPFALVTSAPYDPVPVWPIPKASQTESLEGVETPASKENEEERQRRILQEQWGTKAAEVLQEDTGKTGDGVEPSASTSSEKRHYHLFDGRALAYYMVSQLQFIDPMNRRDLTRPEIVGLDHYLARHGFSGLSVTEAYDKRGISISTAGAVGNTEAGRAAILQQEATQLLNALFVTPAGRPAAAAAASVPPTNRLRAQYQAQLQDEPVGGPQVGRRSRQERDATHGQGGFLVIDDTLYPHLRGSSSTNISSEEGTNATVSHPLWSASHITNNARSIAPQPIHFPPLAETIEQARLPDTSAVSNLFPSKKAAATLSVISKAVKKTDPEELQRQREAREEARRRAVAANLPFGVQPQEAASLLPPLTSITTVNEIAISEAQLERNMAMAEALGIKAKGALGAINKAEFENELLSVVYPDSLILQARERSTLLLKLEKKWTQLVKDESSTSLSLTPMDRPTRVFVHEYSDFWNLQTQSYDPEGKRYIHCRKQLDTRIPYPLLSEALRTWKGPSAMLRPLATGPEMRAPLLLKPDKIVPGVAASGAVDRVGDEAGTSNSRVDGLLRERPKLQLQQRSLPLELPPVETKEEFSVAEELERQRQKAEEKARKERDRKAREQRALEAAFASDDDASLDSGGILQGAW